MSNPGDQDDTPIQAGASLAARLAAHVALGCKPKADWRIGTEHEKFGFRRDDLSPPPYEPDGIAATLAGLQRQSDGVWSPINDHDKLIGLKGSGRHEGGSVSLEPAGQFELSGAPLRTIHETADEMEAHFTSLRRVADPLGLGFAPLGFHPTATRAQMPWMPKSRYAIMRGYMTKVGTLGLDMMQRTCTVQVNLDYGSEADMRRKLHVALALQPVSTALFANSPFLEGKPNGLLSGRAHVWSDVDRARSGMPALFFEESFGFERFVDWVLDVPMYFVSRDGGLIDASGLSFRRWLSEDEPKLAGLRPTIGDFDDHLTTVFTDVRLKRFLEMRGADAGSPAMMVAQSALWVGLLYDEASLAAAHALVRRHPWQAYANLRDRIPRDGLSVPWGGGTLRDLARDMVAIASDGLRARGCQDSSGLDERRHLEPLGAIVDGAPVQAEHWLARYHGPWQGDAARIWAEARV